MDPLADLTARSPHAHESPTEARRRGSEEATSQQCSADPSAFAGLQRAHSVVLASRVPGAVGGMRLTLDTAGSLSQMGGSSQQQSQFNEIFMIDTQHDDDEQLRNDPEVTATSAVEKVDRKAVRADGDRSEGSFLTRLERQLTNSLQPADDVIEIDDEESTAVDSSDDVQLASCFEANAPNQNDLDALMPSDGELTPVVCGYDEVDEDATPRMEEADGVNSEACSDESYPDTQPLDDEEEDDRIDDRDLYVNTEALGDTIDEAAMVLTPVKDQPQAALGSVLPTTATVDSSKPPSSTETKTELQPRSLIRTEKAKDMLQQDPSAFVDTEDQTLAELAERMRRKNSKGSAQAKPPLVPKTTLFESVAGELNQHSQAESQDDLTPTQPSRPVHVALKKRDKAAHLTSTPLTDSQERSYAFIDSSCQCAEAVCECHKTKTTPTKPAVRSSTAIRNLEFSFANPESQESESQVLDSVPDITALASKTLNVVRRVEVVHHETERVEADTKSRKRQIHTETTPKKPKIKNASPPCATRTPTSTRKRGREFMSPDAGQEAPSTPRTEDSTPKKSARGSKTTITSHAVAETSTPNVRTRTKLLSPVPTTSTRSYSSRTKSLFKYRYEFCLTGFMKDGESNLIELIEGHGGKVAERHQDLLQKRAGNKAVVIATPVSWRKLKFMYAIACGIPVVHPEWIHACITSGHVVSFDGYLVPTGYSVTTGKFECSPVRELEIFRGLKFGIPHDVASSAQASTKEMSKIIAFILRACGAETVVEDLVPSRDSTIDVVLADEYTKICDWYSKKHGAHVKIFAWVTECMILQRLLNPADATFVPHRLHAAEAKLRGEEIVNAATAQIGDSDQTTLKLHKGELVLVDLSAEGNIDHFLLFDVCEILSVHLVSPSTDSAKNMRRKSDGIPAKIVNLKVGVLERYPNSPALSSHHTRVVTLTPDKIKRRVVAVSKDDFDSLKYRDESIFYYEDT